MTTVNELCSGQRDQFDLINPKKMPGGKKAKKNYKNSGVLHVLSASVVEEKTLVHYLHAGLELNFSVAIDFTASNGAPNTPSSLHYLNPCQPNQHVRPL